MEQLNYTLQQKISHFLNPEITVSGGDTVQNSMIGSSKISPGTTTSKPTNTTNSSGGFGLYIIFGILLSIIIACVYILMN